MYRVLVVDDEKIMCDGLVRMLEKIPQVSVVAVLRDGIQAKEYLDNHWVDVIFTDIRMPGMDGLELAKYLSNYRPGCAVVLISAYNDFGYAQQAISYGVKNYLSKPIRLSDIEKVLDKLHKERIDKERSLLWHHDLKREILELEAYHALINTSNSAVCRMKKLFFAKFTVQIEYSDKQDSKSIELLQTAWNNIIRWCAPLCISVFTEQMENELQYCLLAEDMEQFPEVEELTERGRELMEKETVIRLLCSGDAEELIAKQSTNIAQDQIADELIIRVKEYISAHLSFDISRTEVANAVHLEPNYFSKYFKKKCGINFHEYLQQQRIEKVKGLLMDGYKVGDAMKLAGFSNRKYFNQVFKEYTGLNPTGYRKKREDV